MPLDVRLPSGFLRSDNSAVVDARIYFRTTTSMAWALVTSAERLLTPVKPCGWHWQCAPWVIQLRGAVLRILLQFP